MKARRYDLEFALCRTAKNDGMEWMFFLPSSSQRRVRIISVMQKTTLPEFLFLLVGFQYVANETVKDGCQRKQGDDSMEDGIILFECSNDHEPGELNRNALWGFGGRIYKGMP